MNANLWIKQNSFLVGILAVIVIVIAFFWWDGRSEELSASTNQAWVEAPAEITPAPVSPAPNTPTPPASSAGTIRWCAQINQLPGGHIPDLLKLGIDNGQGGQDWHSTKTATGNEPEGILNDGTYFIKKNIVDEAAAKLGVTITGIQVKTSENNWAANKVGVLGTVAGQPAWVFK